MLAYVFWHRPRPAVATSHYEQALERFHGTLAAHPPEGFRGSHVSRLDAAPWLDGSGPAYEDWYLIDDWTAVGRLNAAAVHGPRRTPHDAVAADSGTGAGGIYRRVLGGPRPGGTLAAWFAKPAGMTADALGEALDARLAGRDAALWQRQMVLGPTPEFCLLSDEPVDLRPWATIAVRRSALR